LDLRHLRYFTAVAEELHFGRAARRLKVSQPPLSRQISDLERELGVKLLNRTSHRVELTPAGRAFLAESREITAALERAKSTVRSVVTEPSGLLRLGFVGAVGWGLKPSVLQSVVARYPAIEPAMEPSSTAEQVRAVRDHQLDIGLIWDVTDRLRVDGALERLVLRADDSMLAVARSHPLAKRTRISIERISDQTLIMAHRRENPELHDALMDALKRYRVTPHIVYRNGAGIIDLVSAGIAVSFIAASSPLIARQDIVARPFAQRIVTFQLALIWLRGNTLPALKGFLEVIAELKDSGQL
jgi:DNA-binding transcriptional LysR family regulator